MKAFRGSNDSEVRHQDFVTLLGDLLDLSLYPKLREPSAAAGKVVSYSDNEDFWQSALEFRHREGMHVELRDFHITEWLPASPGRYFTPEAIASRKKAEDFWSVDDQEFLPLGKVRMVLGGVGSVRLKKRDVDGETCYFLGATANGITHQGIPLTVPASEHQKIIDTIAERGACTADIQGVLTALPQELSLIRFSRDIPKYCVFVQSLKPKRELKDDKLLGTIAVMYPVPRNVRSYRQSKTYVQDGYETSLTKHWTFCSFDPRAGQAAVRSAADWLADYAQRYDGPKEPIFSEFDEHFDYFLNPIEFPLRSVVDGRPDLDRLAVYGDYYHFTLQAGDVVMGDKFEKIRNATIINRSHVEKSFNKIADEYDQETADALLKIAGEIEKSKNKDAGALFDNFNQELQKPKANKTVLKTIWDGIVKQLPSITSMVDVVSKITSLFAG